MSADIRTACDAAKTLEAPITLELKDGRSVTSPVVHAAREVVQLDVGTFPYTTVKSWQLSASGVVGFPAAR